jgi:hypothetical protein
VKTPPAERSRHMAASYIEANFDADDRLAVIVLNRRTGAVTQRLAKAKTIASGDFQAWLRYKNAQRCEIYISMNALKADDARTREKSDIALVRHIYLDMDHEGAATVQTLLARRDVPRPTT